ncbi:MAG: A/G-specific adenine glycosylase [Phycisphaerales bacterium]
MRQFDRPAVRGALLRWYDRAHRAMPWRPPSGGLGDPYFVLVSELMLQQTQVATVIPYFERFVARWPSIEALAGSDEQQVLHLWQGLGYYRRARHLHQAAQAIVRDFGGAVPDDVESLMRLPGVGRYTAGAIASIAFGRCVPICDGNVARVLARWRAMREPVDSPAGRKRLWQWAERMVAGSKRPGDVNQAMMELGATVCLPAVPLCPHCPVRQTCEASKRGLAGRLPVKAGKTVQKAVRHDVIALRRDGRFMFVQRPRKGLWAGMWQWPTLEEAGDGGMKGRPRKWRDEVEEWAEREFGVKADAMHEVGHFTHITTHRRIAFHVWLADAAAPAANHLWRTREDAINLPMSNAQKRAMRLVSDYISSAVVSPPRSNRRKRR